MAILLIPPLVLPPHVLPQDHRHNNHSAITHNEPRQSRKVSRSLSREEDVCAGNVTRCVEQEPQTVSGAAFRMARNVGCQEVPGKNDRRPDDVLQPRASDKRPAVLERGKTDTEESSKRRQANKRQDPTARILEVTSSQTAQRDDDKLDRTSGQLQQRSINAREPEPPDQRRREIRYPAVDNATAHGDENQAVHFEIKKCLHGLGHLELLRFDADHVARDAINRHNALLVRQELGRGRRVRHHPQEHPGPDEVQQPDD